MIIYLFTAFLIGFSSINFQVMFLREFLIIFYGNELCIGSILGLWLFGIASGASLGAKISGKIRFPEHVFKLSVFMLHFLFPVSIFLFRFFICYFLPGKGELIPFYKTILASAIFMIPVTFNAGLTFPLACQCVKENSNIGVSSGKIYFAESAGALAGGSLFTFVLVQHFDYFQISSALFIISSILLSFFAFTKPKHVFFSIVSIVTAGIILFYLNIPDRINEFSINKRWNAFFTPLKLEKSIDTKYQNISISRQNEQLDVFSNLKYSFSLPPDPFTNEIFINFVLSQSINHENILMIGGVFNGYIDPILKFNPERIDLLELDKDYYDTIKEFIPKNITDLLSNRKIRLYFTDGRFFIKNLNKRYDIILINMPDPETAMANRFYTFEFFKETSKVLSQNGIVVFAISSAENYYGEEVLRFNTSIFKTLKEIFTDVLVTYGERKIFIASNNKGVITTNPKILINRFNSKKIKTDSFSPMIFIPLLDKERLKFVESSFYKIAPKIKSNTDNNPIAYHYELYLWDKFSGSKLAGYLKRIEKLKPFHIISAMITLVLSLLIPQYTMRNVSEIKFFRIILFWAILSTGFSAMGIEILLLFAFQNIFGYLYSMIGFIVALFMSGLMAGSYTGIKFIKMFRNLSSILKILIIIEFLIPVLAFCIPGTIRYLNTLESQFIIKSLFFSVVALCGFLTGIEFPISVAMFSSNDSCAGFSTGTLDAADHYGAFLGAIFAGTFLLPLLGINMTAIIVGLMNFSSFVLVASSKFTIKLIRTGR